MILAPLRASLLSIGTLALLSSTALAQSVDGEAFAQRLQEASAAQNSPVRYEGVATEGDTVILSEVRVGEGPNEVTLGTVRFEGVTGSDAEGWRAERIPFDNVERTQEGTTTRLSDAVLEGLTLEPEGATPAITALNVERMAVGALEIAQGEQNIVSLRGIDFSNRPDQAAYAIDVSVDEFVVDTTAAPAGDGANTLAELGYEQIRGDVSGSGLWNTQTGELSLSPLLVRLQDAGELSIAYAISGYTPAFIQALTQAQQQMAANPDNPGSGIALMGLMAQLTVGSAEIVFRDQSLTNRLLDYYAGENGQTREQMVDSLVASLPLALGYLNNPQFQAEVSDAVEAFLRNPQVLTLAVAPDEPIPATQIMGAAMGAPQTLPAVLGLTVRSND